MQFKNWKWSYEYYFYPILVIEWWWKASFFMTKQLSEREWKNMWEMFGKKTRTQKDQDNINLIICLSLSMKMLGYAKIFIWNF